MHWCCFGLPSGFLWASFGLPSDLLGPWNQLTVYQLFVLPSKAQIRSKMLNILEINKRANPFIRELTLLRNRLMQILICMIWNNRVFQITFYFSIFRRRNLQGGSWLFSQSPSVNFSIRRFKAILKKFRPHIAQDCWSKLKSYPVRSGMAMSFLWRKTVIPFKKH